MTIIRKRLFNAPKIEKMKNKSRKYDRDVLLRLVNESDDDEENLDEHLSRVEDENLEKNDHERPKYNFWTIPREPPIESSSETDDIEEIIPLNIYLGTLGDVKNVEKPIKHGLWVYPSGSFHEHMERLDQLREAKQVC